MDAPEDVKALLDEYCILLGQATVGSSGYAEHDPDEVASLLVREGEWSPSAAEHLLRLANDYGSFMLRNALALSLALGIEDGEMGF